MEEALIEIRDNLYMIPTFGFTGALSLFAETVLVNKIYCFSDILKELETLNFDLVIFDLRPSMALLEKRIISSCQEIISPLTPAYFSADGLEIIENELQKIMTDYRINIRHRKLVLNMVNLSFKSHQIYLKTFEKIDRDVFHIPQDICISKSQDLHLPLYEYDPRARSVPKFQELTKAIIGG